MEERHRPLSARRSKLGLVAILGTLSIATAVSAAIPAAAANGISVFVGYADSLRVESLNFPTPWDGSPGTIFYGCKPTSACVYDGAGVRVVNNSGSTVTVNAIAVHVRIDTARNRGVIVDDEGELPDARRPAPVFAGVLAQDGAARRGVLR